MQQALAMNVLVPLGLGLAVALVLVLLTRGTKRGAEAPEPPAPELPEEPTSEAVPADQVNASRVTAAEDLAAGDADTAPLPVQSEAYLPAVPEPRTPAVAMAANSAWNGAAVAASTSEETDMTEAEPDSSPEPNEKLEAASDNSAERDDAVSDAVERDDTTTEEPADAAPTGAIPTARPESPRRTVSAEGSSRSVAAAVAQALAVREAVDRPSSSSPAPESSPAPDPGMISSRGDVRDRLLAVLLDDPVRAIGAAVELEKRRGQLERLSEAVQHERRSLRDALNRLAGAGLQPEQLAKLASLPVTEVQEMLATAERSS
jgi:hypothetical protein